MVDLRVGSGFGSAEANFLSSRSHCGASGQSTTARQNNPQPLYHNSRPQVSRSMMPRILWGQCRAAIMSASQSARTGLTSAPENNHPADATLLAKLQQTATLANENCDRATALVRKLSAELRDAQQRIRDLERRLETESTLSQLQAEFDAEAENHHTRLQTELAQARQR